VLPGAVASALGPGASDSRDDRDDAVAAGVAGVRSRNNRYVEKPAAIARARPTAMTRIRPLTLRFYVSGVHLNDSMARGVT